MLRRVKLGDIAVSQTGPFGSQLHEEDYVEEGTPIVTVEHLGDIGFTTQNLPFVSEADTKRLSKYLLKEGDIVFSRVGSIDRCVYVKREQENWLFSGRCLRVRCDSTKINPRFLSYYFKQPEFKKMMLNISVGATMPSLNTTLMDTLPLLLVDRDIQDNIAHFLDIIDKKIENNNTINSELEALAKTIYDYWFLQFEFPNEEGLPYKSNGGRMVWSEELKREIPEGWEVKSIFDVADVVYGYPFSTECFSDTEGVPVIRIRDILNNSTSAFTSEEVESRYLTKEKDLLIGMDGIFHMNFWTRDGDYVNQRVVRIRTECLISVLHIYYEILPFIKSREQNVARSTVGHLSDKDMKSLKILVPNTNNYYDTFDTLLTKICNNRKENQELAALRDWLLPMLMNGQVGFKDEV